MELRISRVVYLLFIFFFIFFIFFHRWMSDDFLITVRTSLNFIYGYGPVFNIGERVQAYTHPLWFFIVSGLFAITKEIFYSTTILSALMSLCAIYIAAKAHDLNKKASQWIAFIILLSFSNAFMDYTSSGLESPLGYLLFAVLIWCFLKNHYFFIPLLSALLFLTRQDYILIFAPILIFCLCTKNFDRNRKIISFSICSLLVLSWLIFTLYYYGSLFPNTYYAKMLDYSLTQKFFNAAKYYKATFIYDIVTFPTIILSLMLAFFGRLILDFKSRFLIFCICPYLLYIFRIGGDYMIGRFFSVPFFILSPILVKSCFQLYKNASPIRKIRCNVALIIFSVIIISDIKALKRSSFIPLFPITKQIYLFSRSLPQPRIDSSLRGFFDERAIFTEGPTFSYEEKRRIQQINQSFKLWSQGNHENSIYKDSAFISKLGFLGIGSLIGGKNSFWVDCIGLSDAFLSRLEIDSYGYEKYRNLKSVMGTAMPGHGMRIPPLGYISTLLEKNRNINHICNEELRVHWEKTKIRTRDIPLIRQIGPNLLSSFIRNPIRNPHFQDSLENHNCKEKLQNLYLQRIYREHLKKKDEGPFSKIVPFGHVISPISNTYLSHHIVFDLSATIHYGIAEGQCLEIIVDSFNSFHLKFVEEGRVFDEVRLTPSDMDNTKKIDPIGPQKQDTTISWKWKTYKACLNKHLKANELDILLSCDISVDRFCYIRSIEFM